MITHYIPLLGPFVHACKNLRLKDNDNIYSLSNFKINEKECTNYFKDKTIHYIDEESDILSEVNLNYEMSKFKEYVSLNNIQPSTMILSVPPCGGLSRLNSSETSGAKSPSNRFIYSAVKFYLATNSEMLIFENAPDLVSVEGIKLLKDIKNLIKVNGYDRTVQVVRTSTKYHGIPQNRKRTFVFIHKGPYCKLNQIRREMPTLNDLFSRSIFTNDEMNYVPSLQFKDSSDMLDYLKIFNFKKFSATLFSTMLDNDIKPEETKHLPRLYRYYENIYNKNKNGKGFWDSSIIILDGKCANAVTTKNGFRWVYSEDKLEYLKMRDFCRLMGLPDDFNLLQRSKPNIICQSIPVNTAMDAINWGISILNMESAFDCKSEIIFQDNLSDMNVKYLYKNNWADKYYKLKRSILGDYYECYN